MWSSTPWLWTMIVSRPAADLDVLGLQAVLAELDLDRPIAADHLGVAARGDQDHSRQKEGELRCAQPCHGDAIMIPPSMSRPVKVLFIAAAAVVASTLAAAAAPRRSASRSPAPTTRAPFCSTSGARAVTRSPTPRTHGSAANARKREIVNGPNFDQRCERPVDRVLYAIQNGGFSGAIMPQNIVVGQDARDVAKFVATYSGRQAPKVPGVTPCQQQPIGTLPVAQSDRHDGDHRHDGEHDRPELGHEVGRRRQGRQGQEEELQLLVSVARPPTRSGRPFSTSS